MMKTESTSKSTGSTLRSPSPHRNAYEAGMQALKPVKDNAANGDLQEGPRGRRYGSNVHRIKNMFQQMQSTSPAEAEAEEVRDRSVRLSLPRAGSLNENVDHSALLKLGSTVSERVHKFDPKPEHGLQRASSPSYSKLQETRRIFEQQERQQQDKLCTTRVLLKADKTPSFQDGRLDMARFNGSTESLDSLDTSEAVSPTVSQLSAVFERAAELRNNLHRLSSTPPLPSRGVSAKVGVLNSRIITKRVSAFAAGKEEEGSNQKGQQGSSRAPRGKTSPPSDGVNGGQGVGQHFSTEEQNQQIEKTVSDAGVEAKVEVRPKKLQGDPQVSVENGGDAGETRGSPKGQGLLGYHEGEAASRDAERVEDRTLREDQSELESLDISTYSAAGEDYGGSQVDEEEEDEDEDDDRYEPESSCVEISGLPAEEEPPPSRKIRFSTEPIKVRSYPGMRPSPWDWGPGYFHVPVQ